MIDFAEIRRRVPLRQFVESCGVSLSEDGENWRGKCPLHREKHGASLLIYPDDRWFCHGKCSEGGDVVGFAQAFWEETDLKHTVQRLLGEGVEISQQSNRNRSNVVAKSSQKWPALDSVRIRELVEPGWGLYDLWERSPVKFDSSESHAEQIIDILFPGDPFLCCGWTQYEFETRRREPWRGELHGLQFIVPNPMLEMQGRTQGKRLSQHAKESTAARVYLTIEFDFSEKEASEIRGKRQKERQEAINQIAQEWHQKGISVAEACSALHLDLARRLPLVLVVHSAGRSLHGWYYVYGQADQRLLPFMQYAYSIGADHVTWTRSQFVRMPDGLRDGRRQATFYFDPSQAVRL